VSNPIDQAALYAALTAPFPAADIDFKPGRGASGQLIYITARAVADRLDQVVGPGNWSFTWDAIITDTLPGIDPNTKVKEMLGQHLRCVRGTLSVYGVSKQDIGNYSDIDPDKGAVSDALKRCGVLWGIGRYLYDLEVRDERAYNTWLTKQAGTVSAGQEQTAQTTRAEYSDPHDTDAGHSKAQTPEQRKEFVKLVKGAPWFTPAYLKARYGTEDSKTLDYHRMADLLQYLGQMQGTASPPDAPVNMDPPDQLFEDI
jgi:hypothetical protein